MIFWGQMANLNMGMYEIFGNYFFTVVMTLLCRNPFSGNTW